MEETKIIEYIKDKFNHTLIIDDDECYQDLVKIYALNFSKEVTVCSSVEKEEKLFETRKFDLILTDYFIPNRKFGSDVLKKTNTQTILMSGNLDSINNNDYNIFQIEYFIEKPINPKELYNIINKL